MAVFEVLMPKMGESVEEATITKWFVHENDTVEEDDILLEIATDKVDSEIPSPVAGRVARILFPLNAKVPVGKVIAIIDLDDSGADAGNPPNSDDVQGEQPSENAVLDSSSVIDVSQPVEDSEQASGRFYSPLVLNIASRENISVSELDALPGTGRNNRVRKEDLLNYLKTRGTTKIIAEGITVTMPSGAASIADKPKIAMSVNAGDEIIEMDRIRRLIADHMVNSVHTAPHVTNMVEADVTDMVLWRTKMKDLFQKREGQNLTYMPIITEAVVKALQDFPKVNISVDGYRIILRKNISIGIAVSLPDGNLIVPVIKNANQKSLLGLALEINKLAENARAGKLSPDDIQGGTFSITNFGTFRNVMGTPIINQPQAAILAIGTIEKKPAVLETPSGDVIAIRHKMFLSLTYDHRAIDGALGGAFLKRVSDYLEKFDPKRII